MQSVALLWQSAAAVSAAAVRGVHLHDEQHDQRCSVHLRRKSRGAAAEMFRASGAAAKMLRASGAAAEMLRASGAAAAAMQRRASGAAAETSRPSARHRVVACSCCVSAGARPQPPAPRCGLRKC